MKKYELTISYDPDTERPDSGIGRMVSFGSRHVNFEHPDGWLSVQEECTRCDGNGWIEDYSQPENHNSAECEPCEGAGFTVHTHPDVLATLSYYEHGLCRWMVGESTVPDHGGFDTVGLAGVIVWNGEDSEREWWDGLDDNHRRLILDGIAAEYTSWVNGDTYWYQLAELSVVHDCPNCNGHNFDTDLLESCGGFIGIAAVLDDLRDIISGHEIPTDEITIAGDLADVIDTDDLAAMDPSNGGHAYNGVAT